MDLVISLNRVTSSSLCHSVLGRMANLEINKGINCYNNNNNNSMCLVIGWDKQRNHQINMMRETFPGSFQESAWTTSCMNLSLFHGQRKHLSPSWYLLPIAPLSLYCLQLQPGSCFKLSVHLEL